MPTRPALEIVRRRERPEPLDDRRVRRAVAEGEWIRVAPGSFVRSTRWRELSAREHHVVRVEERTRFSDAALVISHHSAAALHGMAMLGDWPSLVHISRPPSNGGRSSGGFARHPRDTGALETITWGRHLVTTPAQTALDLARVLSHVEGVAVVDQAIATRRPGGPLTTVDAIVALWLALPTTARGRTRAWRAIAAADPLADNVRESQARVVMVGLGFPRPRLQERRILRSGRLVFGDFYFPGQDHWAELDGRGKYSSPEFGAGRDAAAIVIDEKNRENEIRREVRGFSRFETRDVDRPARLFDILTGDGLRSVLPRPRT